MTESELASSDSGCKKQLNVVFHGLWAWESQRERLLAHTPIECHHTIAVGNFDERVPLEKGKTYSLCGVDNGKVNRFESLQNVMERDRRFQGYDLRHCVIELPLPSRIRSARRVIVKCRQPFDGNDGNKLQPEEVSMVQIFIYYFDDVCEVKLEPDKPILVMKPDNQTVNLHFFAQPEASQMNGHDPTAAYEKMAKMFGLEITPIEALFTPSDEDPRVVGLEKQDLRSLSESLNLKSVAESGSNCDGLVIDNRALEQEKAMSR